MNVSWVPVNLPLLVVDHYDVLYAAMVAHNESRQSQSSTVMFPNSASSGLIGGLVAGTAYQFSITVTLVNEKKQLFKYSGPIIYSQPVPLLMSDHLLTLSYKVISIPVVAIMVLLVSYVLTVLFLVRKIKRLSKK